MVNLSISNSLYIGKGKNQKVYFHPNSPHRCIKINYSGQNREQIEDPKIYGRFQKCNIDWTHLAKFYGECGTNFGIGLVFELIKDFDGTVSKTLNKKLRSNQLNFQDPYLKAQLSILKEFLLKQCVVVRDLSENNILVQYLNKTEYRLVIVDGLGHNELIPVFKLSKALTKIKIERRWHKAIEILKAKFS